MCLEHLWWRPRPQYPKGENQVNVPDVVSLASQGNGLEQVPCYLGRGSPRRYPRWCFHSPRDPHISSHLGTYSLYHLPHLLRHHDQRVYEVDRSQGRYARWLRLSSSFGSQSTSEQAMGASESSVALFSGIYHHDDLGRTATEH